MTTNSLPPEPPGQPIHIHMPPGGGGTVKAAVISGLAALGVAMIGAFGVWMVGAVADVGNAVAEVHELANSRLTELQDALAAANERIAELREIIGGMAPPPVGDTP